VSICRGDNKSRLDKGGEIVEVINNYENTEQVGGNWWYCAPICAGSCYVMPAVIAIGVAAYELF
jgi:hypothetical protein